MATKKQNQARYRRMRSAVLSASILGVLPLIGLMQSKAQTSYDDVPLTTIDVVASVDEARLNLPAAAGVAMPAGVSNLSGEVAQASISAAASTAATTASAPASTTKAASTTNANAASTTNAASAQAQAGGTYTRTRAS